MNRRQFGLTGLRLRCAECGTAGLRFRAAHPVIILYQCPECYATLRHQEPDERWRNLCESITGGDEV